ncbi:MAG: hypothetical protein HRT35_37455 [Algicola sp.]|nr:hypothetical protein [Algicola sp.]
MAERSKERLSRNINDDFKAQIVDTAISKGCNSRSEQKWLNWSHIH